MNLAVLNRFRDRAVEVGEQAIEAAEQVAEQVQEDMTDRMLELRRVLAEQIDPDPVPRRMRRWLVIGAVVLVVGMIAGALATWRSRQHAEFEPSNGQHPVADQGSVDGPASAAGNGVSAEAKN